MDAVSIVSAVQSGASRVSLGKVLGPATGIAGVALLGTGAVAVFVSKNTTGTAALIAAGLVLVAIAIYGERIESFEAAGVKLQLAAASTLRAAEKAEAAGDTEKAARLRAEADRLLDAARSVAEQYETIRSTQSSSWERTARLEALLRQSHALAASYSPEAVRELFRTGDDGNRIVAIGMMSANPDLADPESVAAAITAPRSAFEQYHSLRAAHALAVRRPRPDGMETVRDAVLQAVSSDRLSGPDSDRGILARQVRDLLA